jgi:hypothetical protein
MEATRICFHDYCLKIRYAMGIWAKWGFSKKQPTGSRTHMLPAQPSFEAFLWIQEPKIGLVATFRTFEVERTHPQRSWKQYQKMDYFKNFRSISVDTSSTETLPWSESKSQSDKVWARRRYLKTFCCGRGQSWIEPRRTFCPKLLKIGHLDRF